MKVMGPGAGTSNLLSSGGLTQIPWRRQGVSKTTNEIYIDITEEIDAIVERYNTLFIFLTVKAMALFLTLKFLVSLRLTLNLLVCLI